MERFYIQPEAFGEMEARISGDELKHLKNVLRLKAGDRVEVFDGMGKGYTGRLAEVSQAEALVTLEAPVLDIRESPLRICLAQGIPKGDRMDWIVQKATELGVRTVIPLELSRCTVRLEGDKKRRDKTSRWQKIAAEAARQCGRLRVPEVMLPMDLHEFLEQIKQSDLLLIPWEEGGTPLKQYFAEVSFPYTTQTAAAINATVAASVSSASDAASISDNPAAISAAVAAAAGDQSRIYIMIGPEGGMTAEEVEAGRAAGGKALTLGPRILRTDTAGLMLLSVLQYHWGDAG